MTTKPFRGAHFAVFPPDLPKACLLAGCPEGGVVLDPFSGAATTGIVAIQHGRRYIGIELNPEYIELANRRFEETIKTGASRDDALFHNPSREAVFPGWSGGIFRTGW
jgi:DNA modification methylase